MSLIVAAAGLALSSGVAAALFSETLQTYTAAIAPWTLTNVPSGGTLSTVALSSATLTLTLTEGAGLADTTVGTMTVAMATNAAGARDAIGNLGAFAQGSVTLPAT